MSDLGVIVTGAVGAAGIAGTLVSARLTARWQLASVKVSISAQNERERLAEKRRIYARCLGSTYAARLAKAGIKAAHDPGVIAAKTDRYHQLLGECADCLSEVELIAPQKVGHLVQAALRSLVSGEEGQPDLFHVVTEALGRAMRADLGEHTIAPAESRPLDTQTAASEQGTPD